MKRIGLLGGAALLAAALAAPGARAANVSFGLGYDDVFGNGDGAASLGVQLLSDPGWNLGPVGFGLGAALEGDTEGDVWAGGGPTVVWPFADHWAATGSLMAGFYAAGDGGDDLGSDVEFRTRIGVSRSIAFPWRLGLAIEHKSNGGIGDINPGVETVFLTLSRPISGWGYR